MTKSVAETIVSVMLTQSIAEILTGEKLPVPDHEDLSNDLRLRVMEGEDISAEEMLYISNQIRQGRRTAAPTTRKTPAASRTKIAATPEDLSSIMDQDI
jgi:hypothetical protein